jgi:hypothetical protein
MKMNLAAGSAFRINGNRVFFYGDMIIIASTGNHVNRGFFATTDMQINPSV